MTSEVQLQYLSLIFTIEFTRYRICDYNYIYKKATRLSKEFEDTKAVIRVRKSKKYKQQNNQKDKTFSKISTN